MRMELPERPSRCSHLMSLFHLKFPVCFYREMAHYWLQIYVQIKNIYVTLYGRQNGPILLRRHFLSNLMGSLPGIALQPSWTLNCYEVSDSTDSIKWPWPMFYRHVLTLSDTITNKSFSWHDAIKMDCGLILWAHKTVCWLLFHLSDENKMHYNWSDR